MSETTGYVRHFIACNRHDLGDFVPFSIGGKRYGRIRKSLADQLLSGDTFVKDGSGVALASRYTDFASRSLALGDVARSLSERTGKPLRNEMYAVVENNWDETPVAEIDRTAVPWLGVRAWGVHVNGFVRKADGIHLWVGERAADRPADPGKLDNLIGGGQPIGLTPEQNLCKEAHEEAGIPAALAQTARHAQTLRYLLEKPDGLRTDTLIIYDLELPEDFTPQNTDGEVAGFRLLPLPEVADLVKNTDRFKFNCNMVITDFLMRHGFIAQGDPEYAALKDWLKD